MKKIVNYYFFAAVVLYIPFERFCQAILEVHFSSSASFWLAHWYEPITILLLLVSFAWGIKKSISRLNLADWIAFVLLIMGFASVFLVSPSLKQGLEGWRFGLFLLFFYFLARFSDLAPRQITKLKETYLIVALVVSIWALIERFLPAHYWQTVGIFHSTLPLWYGDHLVGTFKQSVSFLGGSNQLASYLLPAFFLLLYDKIQKGRMMKILVVGLVILLTLSRSAIIPLFLFLAVFFFQTLKGRALKLFSVFSSLFLLGCFAFYVFGGPTIQVLFSHGDSQTGHLQGLFLTLQELITRPLLEKFLGSGLGTAGPGLLKFGGGFMPESWYFQNLLELGLVGLILWLFFLILNIKSLLGISERGFLIGFLALLVANLFLHTFSDNPAISYTIFIFLGLYSLKNQRSQHEAS